MWAFNKTAALSRAVCACVHMCMFVHMCVCIRAYELLYHEISTSTVRGTPAQSPAVLVVRPLGNEHFTAGFLSSSQAFSNERPGRGTVVTFMHSVCDSSFL